MKPPRFEYEAPASVDETLGLLGEAATVLAGGQSLVPLLNLRLARPELVVDINGGRSSTTSDADDGPLRIGAMTRQAALERSELVRAAGRCCWKAVRLVGHPQIRTRGTVGGSVAHADPAAELPAALIALGARSDLRSRRGLARTWRPPSSSSARSTTAREPDELLVEIEVPEQPEGAGAGFAEHARTHGDFATAGAAAVVAPGDAGIALLGAGPVPVRARGRRARCGGGRRARRPRWPPQDVEDEHRRALCTELARRAIEEALA